MTILSFIILSVSVYGLEFEPNSVILGETTWRQPYNMSNDILISPSNNQTIVSQDQIAWVNDTTFSWGVGGRYEGSCQLPSGFGTPTSIETEYGTPINYAKQFFYVSSSSSNYYVYDDLCRNYAKVTSSGTNLDASHVHSPEGYDYVLYMLQDMGSNNTRVERYSIVNGQYDYAYMDLNHASIPLGIGYSQKIYAQNDDYFWLGSIAEGVSGGDVGYVIKCYNYANCTNQTYFCWDITKLFMCSRQVCKLDPNACGQYVSEVTNFPANYTLQDFQVAHRSDGYYIIMSANSKFGGKNVHAYYKIIDDDTCTGNYGECNSDLDCVKLCLNGTINVTFPHTCGQVGCDCSTHTCRNETVDMKTNLTDVKYVPSGLNDDNQIGIGKTDTMYYVVGDRLYYNYENYSIGYLKGAKFLDVYPRFQIPYGSYYISKPIDMGTPVDFVSYETDPSKEGAEINVSMRSSPDKIIWTNWYEVKDVPPNRYYQVKIVFGYEKTYPTDVEWSSLNYVKLYYFQRPKGERGFTRLQICPTLDGNPTSDFSVVLREEETGSGYNNNTMKVVTTNYTTTSNCINFYNVEKGIYEVTVFKLGARDKRTYNTFKENITLIDNTTLVPYLVSLTPDTKYNLNVTLADDYTGQTITDINSRVYIEGYPIYINPTDNKVEINGLQVGVDYWAYAVAPNYEEKEFDTGRGLESSITVRLNSINEHVEVTVVDDNNIPLYDVHLEVYNSTNYKVLDTYFDESYDTYLPKGSYRFVVGKSGYLSSEENVNIFTNVNLKFTLHTAIGGYLGNMTIALNQTITGFFISLGSEYSSDVKIIISFIIMMIVGGIGGYVGRGDGFGKSAYLGFSGVMIMMFFFSLIGWLPTILLILSTVAVGLIIVKVLVGVFFKS